MRLRWAFAAGVGARYSNPNAFAYLEHPIYRAAANPALTGKLDAA